VKPDFVLTFDGPNGNCRVTLETHERVETLPCSEVVSFLSEAPGITTASRFEVKTIPHVNVADYDAVMAALKASGYRLTPGVHVGFLTEPKRNDR
jgi:hypothetical protein